MSIDIAAAEQFIYANARLLERHRLAVLLEGAPVDPVLATLRTYRNPDGGFGHALEPDVRCPGSQTAATLQALEVLDEIGVSDDPMIGDVAAWLSTVSEPDGGVPTVLPSADGYPRAPWMVPAKESGFLTFALAAALWTLGSSDPWLVAGERVVLGRAGAPRAHRWLHLEVRGRLPRRGSRPAPRRRGRGATARRSQPGRFGAGPRGRRRRDDQPARHLTSPRVVSAGHCSPTSRSTPSSTGSRRASSTTEAGPSTSCTGHRASPWSGEASSPSAHWPRCTRTDGSSCRARSNRGPGCRVTAVPYAAWATGPREPSCRGLSRS